MNNPYSEAPRRLAALRTRMKDHDIDLVAISPGAHMTWLLGFYPHPDERPCLLLVGPEKEAFLMPALNAEGSREHTDIRFFNWADDNGPDQAFSEALEFVCTSPVNAIALDETMRADFALMVVDRFPDARRSFSHSTIGHLRMIKDDSDYKSLKENALINDQAMLTAFGSVREGMSELELAAIIQKRFSEQGAKPKFWIVGTGKNGAFCHHQPGDSKIRSGDALVVDIGGQKGNFVSDMTRSVVVGTPPDGYEEIYAIVDKAVEAALAAARPGVKAKEVDLAARKVIDEAGYGEYFVHRTGHGLGIEGHEEPYITSTSETVLEEGMVFSIEPGIYLPGRFGIRLEEIVILRKDGPEILSELPRKPHYAEA